jgi:hypothetical protein
VLFALIAHIIPVNSLYISAFQSHKLIEVHIMILFETKYILRTFVLVALCTTGLASADEDPMSPMYEINSPDAEVDLSNSALAGKYVRYGYHSFWEVNKDKGARGAPAKMVNAKSIHF